MEVISDLDRCPHPPGGCVVTIGAYDGVHLGHRRLIDQVRRMAGEAGCSTALVTFDRHPAQIVRPESAPRLLTDLETKLELLASTGIDTTLVVTFDEERSKETAEDFVRTVLVDCLNARAVVVGHDFHFGYRRGGNVALLARMGGELGFDVLGVRLFDGPNGAPFSSTRIRELLAEGRVEEAAELLGRWHRVRGVVGHGGTAEDAIEVTVPAEILLPADGTYAGWYARPDGNRHRAVVTVGRGPRSGSRLDAGLLDVHLPDFSGELHGEVAVVEFVARLREEAPLDGMDSEGTVRMAPDLEHVWEALG
jgi:riboflavin kinase/FMN adenylyltransferase